MVNLVHEIKDSIGQTHCLVELYENVIPATHLHRQFDELSNSIGCNPIYMDAADDGLIRRPRLWWLTIDWQQASNVLHTKLNLELHWSQSRRHDKLTNFLAKQTQQPLVLNGLKLPDEILRGQ